MSKLWTWRLSILRSRKQANKNSCEMDWGYMKQIKFMNLMFISGTRMCTEWLEAVLGHESVPLCLVISFLYAMYTFPSYILSVWIYIPPTTGFTSLGPKIKCIKRTKGGIGRRLVAISNLSGERSTKFRLKKKRKEKSLVFFGSE